VEDFKDRDSVSVAIVRDVKPERVDEFEGWLQEVSAAPSAVDGYAGMDVIRPRLSRGKTPRYTVILRFYSHDKYALWHNSPERAKFVELADEFSLTRPALQERHGLDSWFAPPDDDLIIPPRHKMAILTFGTLYPLILVTGFILLLLPVDVPFALSTLITVGIVAPAATYVVMPWAHASLGDGYIRRRT